jgi:pimeloyl-ACP methyl ester carboxylesterase
VNRADGLDPAHIRFVEADGIRTRIYDAGDGEPLVLIHGGWFASLYSLDCWSLNLPTLAERFRVVAFDKLGQGHTSGPATDVGFTFGALERHALALLDELGLGPVHLVGHSMGALLAARIALDRPELVRTLTVVDTNTLAPSDPRFPRSTFYTDIAKRTPPGPATSETVRMEPDAQAHDRANVTDDFVARLLEMALLGENVRTRARGTALRDTVWNPSLEEARAATLADIDARGLPVPTLVVWAREDVSAPLPLAHALYDRIAGRTPEAELHVIAGSGHYVYREQPDAFERALIGFVGSR